MSSILLVDDEESVLRILCTLFKSRGFEVATASDGGDAMVLLLKQKFDVLLTDVRMRPMDGLALLKFAQDHDPSMQVVMLTAYASVESAIEALKHGAFDYITKPFDIGELVATVDRALAFRDGATQRVAERATNDLSFFIDDIIAKSPGMRDICQKVMKIAATETLVTIIGEGGCGKGLIARALHRNSKRSDKQYHSVNCAVIPAPLLEAELRGYEKGAIAGVHDEKKGLFEQVRGGTLFMEEIGCLPVKLQDLLLDILQNKKFSRIGSSRTIPFSTRLIVSSHADIEGMVKKGLFREDLFFRLSVVSLSVSPLRERQEDVVPLFALLLGRSLEPGSQLPEIPAQTQAILKSYEWSGNAEELENAAAFAAQNLKDNAVVKESLPPKVACTSILPGVLESEPMKARSLKAFLVAEGAECDLEDVEGQIATDPSAEPDL